MARKYDLGSVIGKITFNYDNKGTRQAQDDLDRTKAKAEAHGASIEKSNNKSSASFGQLAKSIAIAYAAINAPGLIAGITQGLVAMSGAALLVPGAIVGIGLALVAAKLGADGVKKAFEGMKPAVDNLKTAVSSSFEKSLLPAVNNLKNLLPQLTSGFQQIATAMGGVATKFTAMLNANGNTQTLNGLLQATARIVQNLGAALAPLGQAFLDIAGVGSQMFVGISAGAGAATQRFADFIREARNSGQIQQWIQTGINAFKTLGQILGQIGGILSGLFSGIASAGSSMGGMLLPMLRTVNEFINSFQGQELIKSLATNLERVAKVIAGILKPAFKAIGDILPPLLDAFATLSEQALPLIVGAIEVVTPGLKLIADFIKTLVDWLGPFAKVVLVAAAAIWVMNIALDANPIVLIVYAIIAAIVALAVIVALIINNWGAISAFFVKLWNDVWKWTSDVFTKIRDFFVNIWNEIIAFFVGIGVRIGAVVTSILQWFADLPGKIQTFLLSLPQMFADAFMWALNAVVQGVEWIIAAVIALPILILQGLALFGQWIADLFTAAWDWAWKVTSDVLTRLVDDAIAFPGRVLGALAQFGQWISDLFRSVWDWAWKTTTDILTGLLNWIAGIPRWVLDRLAALPGWLGDLARNAWNTFKDSAVSAGNSLLNWVQGIPRWILDRLANLGSLLYNVGRDLISGLWNGIQAMIGWLWNNIVGFVGGVVDKVKSLLRIGSPSKVFADEVGHWIPAGIGEGILNNLSAAHDAIGVLADGLGNAINATGVGVPLGQQIADGVNSGIQSGLNAVDLTALLPGSLSAMITPQVGTIDQAAWLGSLIATPPATPSAAMASGSGAVSIQNLTVQVAGNLDPTNPTEWRKAMVGIQNGIRQVERQNA